MWLKILDEIKNFSFDKKLSAGASDVLHGSMWGLNLRYMSLSSALLIKRKELLQYSVRRLEKLLDHQDISFKPMEIECKCGIGFGTYGWKYDYSLIEEAVNFGAVLIDTAEGYGYGKVETELGKALKNISIPVATKVRRDHMSSSALTSTVSRSLEKLGRVSHLQIHFPNDKYSDEVLGKTLVGLRKKGKILSIGLSNCSVDMIESMQRFLSDFSGDVIRSVQVSYSLIDRRIEEFLLPYCQERGILVIAYSPLGQSYKKLHKPILDKIAKSKGGKSPQIALSWLLSKKGVLPIPATNNLEHLKDNLKSVKIELADDEIAEIESNYPL